VLEIPEPFVRNTIARDHERGSAWLATLPGLIDELLQRWNCTPVPAVRYGFVGIVVPVRHPELPPLVLKVSYPHPGNAHEPDAFAAWGGRGAVTLYGRDDAHFAMLLERASVTSLVDIDAEDAVRVAGQLSRRLAVPAPAQLPRLRDLALDWARELKADPLPSRMIDAALANLDDLGPDQPDVLVHGDLHVNNVLRAQREPWLVIDPKGYRGDPAYDTLTALSFGTLLGAADRKTALLRRIAIFAEAAGLDRERAQRWAQVRAVIAAAWGRRHGDPDWLIDAHERIAADLTA
jgi:streptomycin 6-kinase